jgi:hypothetical protein
MVLEKKWTRQLPKYLEISHILGYNCIRPRRLSSGSTSQPAHVRDYMSSDILYIGVILQLEKEVKMNLERDD